MYPDVGNFNFLELHARRRFNYEVCKRRKLREILLPFGGRRGDGWNRSGVWFVRGVPGRRSLPVRRLVPVKRPAIFPNTRLVSIHRRPISTEERELDNNLFAKIQLGPVHQRPCSLRYDLLSSQDRVLFAPRPLVSVA